MRVIRDGMLTYATKVTGHAQRKNKIYILTSFV